MKPFPVFLKIAGRSVLVVGGGAVALDKVEALLLSGAAVRVVSPEARVEIRDYAREGKLLWAEREFVDSDLDGLLLVIAATNSKAVNHAVYEGALRRNLLCNSVDDNENCDCYFGATVQRGDLQIAISTNGESPALAQRLRREIDTQLPEDLGPWLGKLGELRRQVLEMHPRGEERRLLLHQLAQRQICDAPHCATRLMAISGLAPKNSAAGTVSLVGAGPGNPELLTVKALRLIQTAEVILHDDLVPQAILALASVHALVQNVGKRCGEKTITQEEIHARMIAYAREGNSVVRLKSGDPMIFGRAAEEMAALAAAQIDYEVVPGVTAAFAASASARCALTDRNTASSVMITTAHHADATSLSSELAREEATRAVYMPGRDLKALAERWLQEGASPELPCAIISRASQPDERIVFAKLNALHGVQTEAPSIVLAGWSIQQAKRENGALQDELRSA